MKQLISLAFLCTLAACQTTTETICSRKAEIIGAAQATIAALEANCPLTTEPENNE